MSSAWPNGEPDKAWFEVFYFDYTFLIQIIATVFVYKNQNFSDSVFQQIFWPGESIVPTCKLKTLELIITEDSSASWKIISHPTIGSLDKTWD